MKDFLRIELIKSLIFPGLCALWAIVRFLNALSWGADFSSAGVIFYSINYILALIFGCGIPVLLTLTRNIHTEQYLKKRLIILVVMYVGLSFLNMIGQHVLHTIYYLFFGIGSVVYQAVKVHKAASNDERVVIILSDPVIYWSIFHVI